LVYEKNKFSMFEINKKIIFIVVAVAATLFLFVRYYSFFTILSYCPKLDKNCISQAVYYAIDYGEDGIILACNLLSDRSYKAECYKRALERISEVGKKINRAQKICKAIPEDVKTKYYEQYLIKPFCEPIIVLTGKTEKEIVKAGEPFKIQVIVKNEGKIFKTESMFLEIRSLAGIITSEESLDKEIGEVLPGREKEVNWIIKHNSYENFAISVIPLHINRSGMKSVMTDVNEALIFVSIEFKIIVDGNPAEITETDFPITGMSLPLQMEEAKSIVEKFCEPKGYKYDYDSFLWEWDEQKKPTQWKFPTSEPKFSYYASVDVKSGTTNCIVGIKEEWKTYESENIGFDYSPNLKYQSGEGEIDFIEKGGIIPTLSFLSFSPSQTSLEDWLLRSSSESGNKIIWKEVRNDIAGDARDGILYEELTNRGKRIGYIFNHSDDYNDLTYSFWNDNPEERNLFFEILSTIKLKFAFNISKWEIYKNEKYGFEIKYPLDWKYIEGKQMDPKKNGDFIVAFAEEVPVEEYPLVITQELFSEKGAKGLMFKIGERFIDIVDEVIVDEVAEFRDFPRRRAIIQKMLSTFRFLQ